MDEDVVHICGVCYASFGGKYITLCASTAQGEDCVVLDADGLRKLIAFARQCGVLKDAG